MTKVTLFHVLSVSQLKQLASRIFEKFSYFETDCGDTGSQEEDTIIDDSFGDDQTDDSIPDKDDNGPEE